MPTTQTTSPPESAREMLGETVSLLCCMAIYGPPVVFLAAPWLFLALILSGPFALVITLVLGFVVTAIVVAGIAALLATPYVLVRRLRAAHRPLARPAAASVQVDLRRVVA